MKQFIPNQIVVVDRLLPDCAEAYPFKTGDQVLFLGEIPNMKGHCIVVDRAGRVHWGYHTDDFREPREEEL